MTQEEKRNFIANIIKPILIALGMGLFLTLIASFFIPSYESSGANGNVYLTGIPALREIYFTEEGKQTLTIWFIAYFSVFSLPTFIGIISHILWTKK